MLCCRLVRRSEKTQTCHPLVSLLAVLEPKTSSRWYSVMLAPWHVSESVFLCVRHRWVAILAMTWQLGRSLLLWVWWRVLFQEALICCPFSRISSVLSERGHSHSCVYVRSAAQSRHSVMVVHSLFADSLGRIRCVSPRGLSEAISGVRACLRLPVLHPAARLCELVCACHTQWLLRLPGPPVRAPLRARRSASSRRTASPSKLMSRPRRGTSSRTTPQHTSSYACKMPSMT